MRALLVALVLVGWAGGSALAAGPRDDPEPADDSVPGLFERIADKNPAVMRETWGKLHRIIGPKDLVNVLRAAEHKQPVVRDCALFFFHRFKQLPDDVLRAKLVPVLLRALRDKETKVRRRAAAIAGVYSRLSPSIVDRLIQLVGEDDWPKGESGVPWLAVSALSATYPHDKRGYQVLVHLTRSGLERIRVAAFRQLGHMGGKHREVARAIMPMMLGILKDTKRTVEDRGAAWSALSYMGPAAKDAVPTFRQMLNNPGLLFQIRNESEARRFRMGAIDSLGCVGPSAKEAVPDLIKVVEDDKRDEQERRWAMAALGRIGPGAKAAIPALTRLKVTPSRKVEDVRLKMSAELALKTIQGN
jgi:HEAT repeat protein